MKDETPKFPITANVASNHMKTLCGILDSLGSDDTGSADFQMKLETVLSGLEEVSRLIAQYVTPAH